MTDTAIEQNKKNCNTCKYGYLSLTCRKPNSEICGNNFSKWEPISKPHKAESTEELYNFTIPEHLYDTAYCGKRNDDGILILPKENEEE